MVAPDGIIVLPGRKEIDESMKIKGLYDLNEISETPHWLDTLITSS